MAMVALYRPGPMEQIPTYIERMHDPGKIVWLHPELEDVTKETFGVLVYQEQIVLTLQKLAGYTPGQADLVRKAIGKKKRDIMAAEKPRFIEGCLKGNVTEKEVQTLWNLIERFADYSFNRAHAAGYALIAYQTAWLKAHYPVEYMAALLTSVKDRKDDKPKYLHMARKMKIPVLLPDVNSSDRDFTPLDDSIRFGLSAIRHVGESAVEKIIEARDRKGAFESFHDFCRRVDYLCLNKKTVESLIKAGAFESLGQTRKGLLDACETVTADVVAARKQEEMGQFSLFAGNGSNGADAREHHETPISLQEFPKELLMAYEKDMLGLYVSDHPLLGVEGLLARMTDASISSLGDKAPGESVTVGGMVAGLRKKVTKRGDIMVLLDLEELSGATVEVIAFPKVQEQYSPLLRPDAILLIKGRVDRDARDDSVKLIAMEVHEPKLGVDRPLVINLATDSCTPKIVDHLKEILSSHPGSTQVFLHLARSEKTTVLRLGSQFAVDTRNGLFAELKAALGPHALVDA
jgi:DNA polymerase-3 subunit alpha